MAHNHYVLLTAIIVSIAASMITGSFSAFLTTLFPMMVRYSGVALCYNIGFAIFGGLTPLVATYFIHISNDNLSPAYIVMLVSILGISLIKEVKRNNCRKWSVLLLLFLELLFSTRYLILSQRI